MKDNPLRDPAVLEEIERRAALLEQTEAGKLTIELNCKDGRWALGNVGILFAKRHGRRGTAGEVS